MSAERWSILLAGVTGLHLGFQVVVSVLVYPALARGASTRPDDWALEHRRHSTGITPLVVVVYGAAVLVSAGVLVDGPSSSQVVAVIALAVAGLTTAAFAAPMHERLGRAAPPDPGLLARLRGVDLLRTAAALVAFVASVAA